MDLSFLDSTAYLAAKQSLGFDRFETLLIRQRDSVPNILVLAESSADQVSGFGALQISALVFDAVAPPPVKPKSNKRSMIRKKRRLRRRSKAGGGEEDDGFFGEYGIDSGGDGGYFGGGQGGSGGGGGGGWNFGGFGWDESSSYSSASDPASDFVYEVICWIALSNCAHFAFNKVVRGIGELIVERGRQKVSMRLGSIC